MDKQVAALDILTLNQIIENDSDLPVDIGDRNWQSILQSAIILYQNLENIVCSDVESVIGESIESISHYTE